MWTTSVFILVDPSAKDTGNNNNNKQLIANYDKKYVENSWLGVYFISSKCGKYGASLKYCDIVPVGDMK